MDNRSGSRMRLDLHSEIIFLVIISSDRQNKMDSTKKKNRDKKRKSAPPPASPPQILPPLQKPSAPLVVHTVDDVRIIHQLELLRQYRLDPDVKQT